jgi:uncharacterized membrane protein YqjE
MSAPSTGRGAGAYDPATEPKQPDKSLADLVGDMTSELGELFRQEVELAKVETQQELAKAGRAGGMIAGAAIGLWLALLLLSLSLAWLLDDAINRALAFAIVGVAWALVGLVLLGLARSALKAVRPSLPVTTHTLKEDVRWARAQKT